MNNDYSHRVNRHVNDIYKLARKHRHTWRNEPEGRWFARLVEEVGELASAMVNRHEHPPETELKQIASICLNWLDMRDGDKRETAIGDAPMAMGNE